MTNKFFATIIFAVFAMSAMAANEVKFINVDIQVTEQETPTEVKLRVPMGMINAFAPQVNQALNEAQLEEQEIDFVGMWNELRNAGPNNFITVDGTDGTVNVSTTETELIVSVESDEQNMKVTMPLAVGDAFFAQDGDFSLETLLAELQEFEGQDLVTIEGDNINGRVWID